MNIGTQIEKREFYRVRLMRAWWSSLVSSLCTEFSRPWR